MIKNNMPMDFNVQQLDVDMFGVGGMKIGGNENRKNLLSDETILEVNARSPKVIVLWIGDNDIKITTEPHELSLRILSAVDNLFVKTKIEHVCLMQLIPRFLWDAGLNTHYDFVARQVNQLLKAACGKRHNLSFHFHDFTRFRCEKEIRYYNLQRFYKDDVHLNDEGNYKLFRSIRGLLITLNQGRQVR